MPELDYLHCRWRKLKFNEISPRNKKEKNQWFCSLLANKIFAFFWRAFSFEGERVANFIRYKLTTIFPPSMPANYLHFFSTFKGKVFFRRRYQNVPLKAEALHENCLNVVVELSSKDV
jgi:hypothetical protein